MNGKFEKITGIAMNHFEIEVLPFELRYTVNNGMERVAALLSLLVERLCHTVSHLAHHTESHWQRGSKYDIIYEQPLTRLRSGSYKKVCVIRSTQAEL